MTNQEALNTMCERCRVYNECMGTGCSPKMYLQKLVDKTIPKEPIRTLVAEYVAPQYRCPTCTSVKNDYKYPHCRYCGQALDWSEVD